MSYYQHQPLEDAATDIRLLQKVSNEDLRFTLDTWPRHSAPPYKAISYTWGANPNQDSVIIIDGKPFGVSRNCHTALTQASRRGDTLWVDSICIDQSNTAEKGSQVSMMGEIFMAAKEVLACVGLCESDDSFLFYVFRVLSGFIARNQNEDAELLKIKVRHMFDEIVIKRWQADGGRDSIFAYYERFARAWMDFGHRVYWSRLWVVQEIWLARDVIILCGSASISLIHFARPYHFMPWRSIAEDSPSSFWEDWNAPESNWFTTKMSRILTGMPQFSPDWKRMQVTDIMEMSPAWHCTDFRDKVYGLLNVTEWPRKKPEPDYNISKLGLLLQFIDCMAEPHTSQVVPAADLSYLMTSIRISVMDNEVSRLIRSRDSASWPSAACECLPPSEVTPLKLIATRVDGDRRFRRACRITRVGIAADAFTADLEFDRVLHNSKADPFSAVEGASKMYYTTPGEANNFSLAGYICPQAQEGDYLIQGLNVVWFIARHCPGDKQGRKLHFVGYAVLAPKDFDQFHIPYRENADVFVDPEDLIVWLLHELPLNSTRPIDSRTVEMLVKSKPTRHWMASFVVLHQDRRL